MKTFVKRFSLFIVALLAICSAYASEQISFTLNAPMIASVGETVPVEFQLNAKPDRDSFSAPSFENFDVVAGPSVSQGSSIQWINGEMTKTVSYAITYVLIPQRAGTFTIGSATIVVKGKSYSTQPTTIEVRSNQTQSTAPAQSGGNAQNESLESRANNTIGADDLLLRFEVSDKSVYKGEPIRALLKLYSRVNLAGSESLKMPVFNGFWSQQLDVERVPFRETLNGKVYETYHIAEYLLYPQQGGVLTIDPAELTVIAQVVVPSNRGFDPFFGGREVYKVRRVLKTPKIEIDVKEFPEGAPSSFTGAVGRYTIEHKLSTDKVAANSAVTLQLTIKGTGNLNFIQAPTLNLPNSFELYDVKSEEKVKNSASGSVGWRRFDYPFIVRAEGNYDIAPVEFTYFDVDKQQYVTLSTDAMHIEVAPDTSVATQQQVTGMLVKREEVRLLGSDINFIKTGMPHLRSYVAPLVLSPLYFVALAIIVFLAMIIYFIVRKHMRDSRNVVLVKGKRANKVAIKRFRIAERYMREDDRRAFYEEMLRALWGYLSDRLNIPVADLTKESVRQELARRGAEAEGERILAIIQRCEEAQYSPMASSDMNEVYGEGVDVISKTESAIKR